MQKTLDGVQSDHLRLHERSHGTRYWLTRQSAAVHGCSECARSVRNPGGIANYLGAKFRESSVEATEMPRLSRTKSGGREFKIRE